MSLNRNLIDVILRQTDYTEEQTIEKLKEHNNSVIAVVREYMSGTTTKPQTRLDTANKSTNQQIYGEIRNLMDDAAKSYKAKKDFEKKREEYIAYMQARAQAPAPAAAQAPAAAEQAAEQAPAAAEQAAEQAPAAAEQAAEGAHASEAAPIAHMR